MRYSTTRQQTDHSLRAIRALTDEARRSMSTQLERLVLNDGLGGAAPGRPGEPDRQFPRRAPDIFETRKSAARFRQMHGKEIERCDMRR